ncbi:hypothetical protein LAN32_23795, partial [Mycobacterium tuberculosis]|nr:hypothetical protein [Mycobacterium tuberculosis]
MTVGIAYEACRVDALPAEAHDLALHWIVTDGALHPAGGCRGGRRRIRRRAPVSAVPHATRGATVYSDAAARAAVSYRPDA